MDEKLDGLASYVAGETINVNDFVRCPRGRKVFRVASASKDTPCNKPMGRAVTAAKANQMVLVEPLQNAGGK